MKKFYSLLLLAFVSKNLSAQEPIQYTLSFENAVHHEALVSMYIPQVPAGALTVRMSRSSPGRYATHEFGKNIYNVHAFDADGKEIAINQVEGDVYEVPNHQAKVKITYTLFGNWVDGTYTSIDYKHAHLNMPATFMWAPALQNNPIEVKFLLPQNWKVGTQLIPKNGVYYAPNLQYFMDSPTELSDFKLKNWEVQNTDGLRQQINIVYHGATSDSIFNDFESKVKKIVNEAQAVYGELPNYDNGEYRFLIDVAPNNAGDGMEHRNSTIITTKGESLDQRESGVLGTVAHEYFHSWNVERMRPKTIEPFNFEKANMSDGLWFAEGFTQYYGELLLTRARINSQTDFINTQGVFLNLVLNSPGANKYSPIFMSQRAVFVDAGVAIDQNNNSNIFSSYYLYGDVTALALDLTLRNQFKLTLDDYMKAVWKAHGKTEIAYQISDLEKILADFTHSPDFAHTFFSQYVYGVEKADYNKLLAPAGYLFKRSKADEAWLGNNRFQINGEKAIIASPAIIGSPLYQAGLDAGDAILKLDETNIKSEQSISDFLKTKKPGDAVKITFERDGKALTTVTKLLNNPFIEVVSFENAGMQVTPEIKNFRESWLGSKSIK
ncbi:PDZ domain-containing protein [Pelobium sp.]|nr:PDZ domain-containing protein [Pelobium sp.]MDA9554718.1 PDZ domain-containing protein [Pelobium sp.]